MTSESDKPKQTGRGRAWAWWIAIGAALAVIALMLCAKPYMAAYRAAVEPWIHSPAGQPDYTYYMYPRYKVREGLEYPAEIFFYPAYTVDTFARPHIWGVNNGRHQGPRNVIRRWFE